MNSQEKIEAAKVQAVFALRTQMAPGYVIRSEDMDLISFNTMRGDYMATFNNGAFPDHMIFVQKQGDHVYTAVHVMITRFAEHDTDPLPGL